MSILPLPRRLALAASLCLAGLAASAEVQDLTVEAALAYAETVIERFDDGDLAAIYAAQPEAQLALMAEAAGTTPEALIAAHVAKVERSLEMIEVEYSGLVPDSFAPRQTAAGRAFVEGQIEEYWRMDEWNMFHMITPVVIMEEGGTLRMVSVADRMDRLTLRMAYPDFAGLDFAPRQMLRVWDNELPEGLQPR